MLNTCDSPVDLKQVRTLLRQGDGATALERLRDGLARGQVAADDLGRAGALIPRCVTAAGSSYDFSVLLLGKCTTSWLAAALACEALGRGRVVRVIEARQRCKYACSV